jgi:hypothetical protein
MRKILSFLMISLMAVSLSAKTIYLNTGGASLWNQADAVFFAHSWGSEDSDVLMTLVEGDVFSAEIPDGNTSVVFVRMAPGSEAINWDTKWNQSTDQQIPNDQNCFTMTDWSNGTWSVYAPAVEDGDAIVLTFTCHNSTSGDGSAKLSTVEAIFDEASQAYVSEVNVGSDVYAGRKYAEGSDSIFSNLKLGTSSKAGELKFTLANPTEVDSIVFRAAMYANNEGGNGFSVNGTAFTLSAGKLLFEDKVWTPTGEVSSIDIVQTTANKGRFFLTSITIYPKAGDTPQPPVVETPKFYITGNAALVGAELQWNPAAIPSMEDSKVLALEAGSYMMKVTKKGNWDEGVLGYDALTGEIPAGVTRGEGGDNDNICFTLVEAGDVTVTYTAESFTLAGNFYVAPVEEPAKFYVTGDSALVVDAGLEAEKAWAPQAIRVDADTMVLNLNAEQEYKLKITLNGEWATGKGYSSLTETLNGLTTDGDDNIIFTLAEAGEVKVVYIAAAEEQEEIFKVIGNFYVAPEPVKQYMVYGEAAIANGEDWNENSDINVMTTTDEGLTYVLTIEGVQLQALPRLYEFKIIEKGNNQMEYYPRQYGANASFHVDESGIYNITYTYTVATQNCVMTLLKTGDIELELENGYYLVGTMNDWTPAAENLFEQNPDNEAEYQLTIDLEVNDEIKVVYVENDAIVTWYPNEGGNYVIDDHHNGATTMYFRPDYQGGDDWFAACIYVAPTSTVDITNIDANVEAVKVLRDAQILIIKGEKVYNVMGQTIK